MDEIPQRHSLISQTVSCLRSRIAAGAWQEWLPGERTLMTQLQVSRNTLRSALAELRKAGIILSKPGLGTLVTRRVPRLHKSFRSRDVALLTPFPLEELQPRQTLLIDELRGMLGERGCRLRIVHGGRFFRANSGPVLRKLVESDPHGCWILNMSNEEVQRWFFRNRIPSIVAGSVYPGVILPFSDLDHRAMSRHAAGVLLRLGHQRIGYLGFKSNRAGEVESAEGFREAFSHAPRADLETAIAYHDGSLTSIRNTVQRLLEQKMPPTALVVANAFYFLAVASRLSQLGRRIPQDLSLISRDEGSFLSFFMPAPARYVASPKMMAKNLLRPVLDVLKVGFITRGGGFLMPEFIRGETIGPPPA